MNPTTAHLLSASCLVGLVAGCNFKPPTEDTPCQKWKSAVEECAVQANVGLDSGSTFDSGITPQDFFASATCSKNSDGDPQWMQDLYDCYTNVYENTNCADPADLVELSIQIADCGIINGG
jgi:hypothetical protein